jgi:hypothetical protein
MGWGLSPLKNPLEPIVLYLTARQYVGVEHLVTMMAHEGVL